MEELNTDNNSNKNNLIDASSSSKPNLEKLLFEVKGGDDLSLKEL